MEVEEVIPRFYSWDKQECKIKYWIKYITAKYSIKFGYIVDH